MSEGNVLFSPPTGPRGFLGYPSVVYASVYAIVRCVLSSIRACRRLTSYVGADRHIRDGQGRYDVDSVHEKRVCCSYLFVIGRLVSYSGAKARKSKLTFSLPPDMSAHCRTAISSLLSISISNDLHSCGEERD